MGVAHAEPLSAAGYDHGEGIRWDPAAEQLLWVDISAGRFLRAPLTAVDAPVEHRSDRPIGAVTPVESGGWLLAAGQGLLHLTQAGHERHLVDLEPPHVRMNDGACDPSGRFWFGSMPYDGSSPEGRLHVLDLDGAVQTALAGLTISNGLGWSPDGRVMYLNDSGPSTTWAFDVDAAGDLSGRRALVRHEDGACDGMTVDDEGCLWIPLWGGAAVDRIDPRGRRVQRVQVPARQPSDCCLVGTTLVITTATHGMTDPGPLDGRLFAVDVGVSGPAVRAFAGALPSGQPTASSSAEGLPRDA